MKVGIIGASGYTGAELMRILSCHPHAEVSYVSAHTYSGQKVDELYPHLHHYAGLSFEGYSGPQALSRAEFHFVALPHGKSMQVVPELLDGGARVVDLSADFRLDDPDVYSRWYKLEHTSAHLLREAVYGLPEIWGGDLPQARLVAVPGCYPTAVILALAPLAEEGYLETGGVIVDAKSGLSGAGRSLSLGTHFAQADESVKPYSLEGHRHAPEMEQALSSLAGGNTGIVFAPHLIPMSRGILATCYVRVGHDLTAGRIDDLYREYYAAKPFVVTMGEGCFPETKAVSGSNFCQVGWWLDSDKGVLAVASAIDNLVKGASGQAVQCMNIMQGWSEDTGLEAPGIFP